MITYIIRRLILAVPTVLIVVLLVFSIIRLLPGDVVEMMVSQQSYAADKDEMRRQLGLADPVHVQFSKWVGGALRGDFGQSLWTKQPVMSELRRRFPVTMELGLYALLVSVTIAIPIGILSAIRQDTVLDYLTRSFAIALLSIPSFWLATLVLVFPVVWFGWSPSTEFKGWSAGPIPHLSFFVVPAVILGSTLSGAVMRMMRTLMLEVLRQDYIRTALAKGLQERNVIARHALKNALIPVITIIGLQVGVLIGGTVIIETIFNVPGIGRFFYDAIIWRDYPAIQGVIFFIAIVIVLTNLLIDVVYAVLDPRIHYQ